MVEVQIKIRYAGFYRDICDNCTWGLLEQLQAERPGLVPPQPEAADQPKPRAKQK